MNSKPVVTESLRAVHTSFKVDFKISNNITLILGDSGVGRSVVFSILKETSVTDSRIIPISYLDQNKDIEGQIISQSSKLIIVDNADVLLTDNLRKHISFDSKNQYIIFGRNPKNLLITRDNMFELQVDKKDEITIFSLIEYL